MKRTTLWKLTAMVLLVAVTLPIFSAVAPPTTATAATTVAPLPYAMEQYGQHHSGIYFAEAAPAIDGVRDASYTLMDAFTDSAGQFNGVFLAANPDGTGAGEENDEWVADKLDIYGAYDSDYAYFYVETETRTDTAYSITPKFGFNFTSSQKDAQEGKALPSYEVTEAAKEAGDGANWIAKTQRTTPGNDSSTGYTDYDRNATVYEFRVAWADIAPEGKTPELDFDRMYMSLVMPFLSNGTKYWIYGVPNNALLPNDALVGDAFGSEAGTYTPNVVNLLGSHYDEAAYPAPQFLEFKRTDKNTNATRSFRISYTVSGVKAADIEETGVLFAEDASIISEMNMTVQTAGIEILSATLDSDADGVLTYTATFSTTSDNYEKYFSLRPFVKYSGEGAPTVYADYYSNTPSYYDTLNSDYNRYLKVLMIGCSFSSYYKDELIALCKAEGIHLTLGRVYYSGMKSHEHWDWLLNDYEESGLKGELRSSTGTIYGYVPRTVEEVIHFVDDWDVISMQDHYGISFSHGDPYAAGMAAGMPYMTNLFRYLRVNFPEADLYLHQTWAFQLGYGYANGSAVLNEDGTAVIGGTINGSSFNEESSRMMTVEQQTNHHNNIMKITNSLSEKMGVPMIPSGSAWAIARAHELIGDHLCDGKNGAAAGDYYHDGEGGGGQYLNACVWYEIITGNDVTKASWKPVDYEMSDEKAEAIREVAHQAVEEYKQTASWKNQTINK